MKRDVGVVDGKVVVKARADDAIAKLRQLNLPKRIADGARLTDAERDVALLALLQKLGIIEA